MAYHITGENYYVVYCSNYRVGSTATINTFEKMGFLATDSEDHHAPPEYVPEDALVVETVRHHCDVILSLWYKRQKGRPLEEFVKMVLGGDYPLINPETMYSKFDTNYIMRYETLQHEFDNLCITAGLPVTELVKVDSPRPDDSGWQKAMPQNLADIIYKQYKEEMDKLGYGCNKSY